MDKDLREERRRHIEATRHLIEGARREVRRATERVSESKRVI
jgi:hypothetical protein